MVGQHLKHLAVADAFGPNLDYLPSSRHIKEQAHQGDVDVVVVPPRLVLLHKSGFG
jgi:hypothetical protein